MWLSAIFTGAIKGAIIGLVGMLIFFVLLDVAFGDETSRVYDATIGQQDRSLSPDSSKIKGYDNSSFIRDMEAIRGGYYVDPNPSNTPDPTDVSDMDITDDN